MRLRVSRLHHPVTALGPGTRAGIWVQGCSISCEGCMSRDTWDPDGGGEVEVVELLNWLKSLPNDELDGVTISGGEPFQQLEPLGALLEGLTAWRPPDFDIFCYSGFGFRRLRRLHPGLLANIDAVVTGPYVQGQPTDLIWRGSANQELVMLTDLGRSRYGEFVDCRPAHPHMQITVQPESVRFVGVPRPGDLDRLQVKLAEAGVELRASSWQA